MSRRRAGRLAAGLLGLVLCVVLGALVPHHPQHLSDFDLAGRHLERLDDRLPWLHHLLLAIELMFGTVGMTLLVTVTTLLLWRAGRRPAAVFSALVPLLTACLTTVLKLWLGRDRPPWQDPSRLLETKSYPSGHASAAAAFAGVLLVLAWLLLRPSGRRTAAAVCVVLLWAVVCLDRVMLGRHYPTDVVGGTLLGAAVVLIALAVWAPRPAWAPRPVSATGGG